MIHQESELCQESLLTTSQRNIAGLNRKDATIAKPSKFNAETQRRRDIATEVRGGVGVGRTDTTC